MRSRVRIDENVFAGLVRVGPKFVGEVVDAFEVHARETCASLASAAVAGQFDEVRRHAHSIRGLARNVGAESVADLAVEIETAAKESRASTEIPELRARVDAAVGVFRERLSALPAR